MQIIKLKILGLLLLNLFFLKVDCLKGETGSDSVTIYPVEYSGAIRNPLKGFKEWFTDTNNEWSTVGKYYIGWNQLENNAHDGLDKILDWTNAHFGGLENKNIKIVPRVWLDYPGKDPAWPADMMVGDYTSEQFKTRLKAFVKKLGQAWDNDPRIAYIEMGIIGKWGEQHSPSPDEEMQKILFNVFSDAFKSKKVLRRYPWEFVNDDLGIYWDSFAHWNEVVTHEPAMLNMGDYWKTQIVEGETAYDWGDYKIQPGDDPDDTMMDTVHRYYLEDLIYELHCSGLGWVTHYNQSIPEAKAGGEEVQKTFGYRFVLDDFSYPKRVNTGEPFSVSFKVINKGSAPFYYNWPVELSFLDEDKNVVWRQKFSNVDIRTWFPGDDYNKETNQYETAAEVYNVSASFEINKTLKPGTFTMAISILDPDGDLPSLRFAINNYFNGGRHPMGYVGVGTDIEQFEIPPNDFDQMRSDHSLHYDASFTPGYAQKIIFDCDFGDDGDDLAALCMLHNMQDNNECEIIAIGQCNNTPKSLRAIDIINTYYGRPDIPLGQQQSDTHLGDQYITYLIDNYPELTDLDNSYSPDVVSLYRKVLSEAPDNSVNFIVTGLKKDMADLLKSEPDEFSPLSGGELFAQKVAGVYDMGGIFPSGKEFNYELEPASTKYYIENCPVPFFFAGDCWGEMQIGEILRTMNTPPGRALDHKLAGNGGIYWDGKPVEETQSAFDCAPVFAAVRGQDAYFNVIAGCNHINVDGSNFFTEGEGCSHVYAPCSIPKISLEDMADEIEEMIITPPLNGDDGNYQLSVFINGNGTVSPSSGRYSKDTTLNMVATPDAGSIFTGWGGDLSGTENTVSIALNGDKLVTAFFQEVSYQFTTTIEGHGSVIPVNGNYKGSVDIIATPDEGYKFQSWSGDLTSTNYWEVVNMDSNINVTATFTPLSSVEEQNNNKPDLQVYPNPFSRSLNINYRIISPTFVKLSIYNNLKQEVATLINENQKTGDYSVQWSGVDKLDHRVNSGVYYFILKLDYQIFIKKIVFKRD